MIWNILTLIAIVLLIANFSRGRNSVWGGLTIGIVVGTIWAIVSAVLGNDFSTHTILRVVTIGVLAGFVADLIGKLSDKWRASNH